MNAKLSTATDDYRQGNLDEAMAAALEVVEANPDDGRGWELIGLICFDRELIDQCVDALERASLIVPLSIEAQICLARGYGQLGKRALSRDLLAEIADLAEPCLETCRQVAAGFDAIDLPQIALVHCRAVAEHEPDSATLFFEMGYYAVRAGWPPSKVIALARKAIDLEPDSINFRVGLALYLRKQGMLKEARKEVASIDCDRIAKLSCQCCLEKLAGLFDAIDDVRGADCRRRLNELS